jgi:epidermal growth factor receptor substrate 15
MELDEKEKYEYLFSLADADKDGVIGLQDANFFARSGLQRPALGRIWAEVNVGGLTYLKKEEFCTALKLIALAQNGRDPSIQNLITTTNVPMPRLEGVQFPTKKGSGFEWRLTEQHINQFRNYFDSLDADRDGLILAADAKQFFLRSQLATADLGKIWYGVLLCSGNVF